MLNCRMTCLLTQLDILLIQFPIPIHKWSVTNIQRINHSKEHVRYKSDEVSVVEITDRVERPRAIMVHVENQTVTNLIVM